MYAHAYVLTYVICCSHLCAVRLNYISRYYYVGRDSNEPEPEPLCIPCTAYLLTTVGTYPLSTAYLITRVK